ncbi:hypothetical protein OG393_14295 [Streptomyces sp. NBC_01216]|uniref:hypothetical protein n=1 Tax=Streptomyces sp. NBC_01216 TaxID=2903778 RepID=UPI002E10B71B|nr:hypothetical protein OG393_14295 [Streptomyces sp. NBC_01216]
MSRTARALASFAALAGVLLVALGCGTDGTGRPGASDPTGTVRAGTAAAVPARTVVTGTGSEAPGCGERHPAEGAARPATPPRPHGLGEPPSGLAGGRATADRGADQDVHAVPPGRTPPDLAPPSPVELSILRV